MTTSTMARRTTLRFTAAVTAGIDAARNDAIIAADAAGIASTDYTVLQISPRQVAMNFADGSKLIGTATPAGRKVNWHIAC